MWPIACRATCACPQATEACHRSATSIGIPPHDRESAPGSAAAHRRPARCGRSTRWRQGALVEGEATDEGRATSSSARSAAPRPAGCRPRDFTRRSSDEERSLGAPSRRWPSPESAGKGAIEPHHQRRPSLKPTQITRGRRALGKRHSAQICPCGRQPLPTALRAPHGLDFAVRHASRNSSVMCRFAVDTQLTCPRAPELLL